MTPEMAFSHPFIAKAVNELKCLRTGSQGNSGTQGGGSQAAGQQPQDTAVSSRNTVANARTTNAKQQQQQSQNTVKSTAAAADGKTANGQSDNISQGANSARSNNNH